MPTQHEVWTVADKIRAKPARVSIRSVRAGLPRGGSMREVGQHLRSWKSERSYLPGVELSNLPKKLQNEMTSFATKLWEAAMVEATSRFEADRQRYEEKLAVERELLDEALGFADLFEARALAAERDAARLALEALTAREAAKGFQRKLRSVRPAGEDAEERRRAERREASAFWRDVVGEATIYVGDAGRTGLTRDEIWNRLSPDLRKKGVERGEDFAPVNLSKRLDERVLRRRFFERIGDRYRRLQDGEPGRDG